MKIEFICKTAWKIESENDNTFIKEGDKVRITYDKKQNLFSDWFLKDYPEETLEVVVVEIKKTKIKVNIPNTCWYLEFKPNQIIKLERI